VLRIDKNTWRNSEPAGIQNPGTADQPWFYNTIDLTLNHLNTVVVVAITSNLGYALYLQSGVSEGKGSLPKICVANVTQIQTIGRAYLIPEK
jgi:hypothetical protein